MINKIESCKKRQITDSFQNIGDLVEFIKSPPSEHIELVNHARWLFRSDYASDFGLIVPHKKIIQ
ncbi:hypothetical protein AB9J70_12985 [Elizabethkingia anophelis]|uniref:hypothetical protein n=1 Tax=Elizabethkingia anophelis TaxID=1117645 RepID=UPI003558F95E